MSRDLFKGVAAVCGGAFDKHVHFLVLHYLYIIVLCFAIGGLYYCQPGTNWHFVDALYMGTTGATNTGLNTIAMSELSVYQCLLMFFSSILGSRVVVSIIIVHIRKYYFSKQFEEQRYQIDSCEYCAIDFLSKLIPIWYVAINFIGALALRVYIASSGYAQQVLQTSNPTPVDPWLFSFFVVVSSFDNLGLSLLDTSMVPFLNAPVPLLISASLIMLGGTAYPISLRAIIWCMHRLIPKRYTTTHETLQYLLDHPRRCYTSLFPSTQTWWLLFVLVLMNLIMTVVFIATNFFLPVLEGVSWPSRVLDGFFQGVSTRNAGFVVVNLLEVNPGTQICYCVMMYISAFPVAISIRNSNAYQERELGIYSRPGYDDEEQGLGPIKLRRRSTMTSIMSGPRKRIGKRLGFYVVRQLQRQLAHEISWLILGVFAVCVIEAESIMSSAPITALTVLYECCSAFGTAGSSTGYPGASTAQSAQYHTSSKLVIIALMIRGRHRDLPSTTDRAVQLPSDRHNEEEIKKRNASSGRQR